MAFVRSQALKRLFDVATPLSEGESIVAGGDKLTLTTPCAEGMLVQTVPMAETLGGTAWRISPTTLRGPSQFLSALSGTVRLEIANRELTVSAPKPDNGMARFSAGVRPATNCSPEMADSESEVRVSGKHLREALRMALPPCLPHSPDRPSTHLFARATRVGLEVVAANGLAASTVHCPAQTGKTSRTFAIPPFLLRRVLSTTAVWSGAMTLREGFLGRKSIYLTWPQTVDGQRDELLAIATPATEDSPGCSCWVKLSDVLSAFNGLRAQLKKNHPPAIRFQWTADSVELAPVFESYSIRDTSGSLRAFEFSGHRRVVEAVQRLDANTVRAHQAGSVTVPTEALYLIKEVMPNREYQLKLSGTGLVLGSPSCSISVPAIVE